MAHRQMTDHVLPKSATPPQYFTVFPYGAVLSHLPAAFDAAALTELAKQASAAAAVVGSSRVAWLEHAIAEYETYLAAKRAELAKLKG